MESITSHHPTIPYRDGQKVVAIVQSSYIPWKGYFDLINQVDEIILFDETQYTKRDWRNRNSIKTPHGCLWLTIPIATKGKYLQAIKDAKISDNTWAEKHWKSIVFNYRAAKYFTELSPFFHKLYQQCAGIDSLSQVNYLFIKAICQFLGINTRITWSMDYPQSTLTKTGRLVELCKAAQATHYISGPLAKNYIELEKFQAAHIELSYLDYLDYPPYTQLYGDFDHHVSIIDLIFNEGSRATHFMNSFNERAVEIA